MLKPLTRSFFVTIALLSVFAAPSALGAHHSRPARTHAGGHRAKAVNRVGEKAPRSQGDARRASQQRKLARRSHRGPKGIPTPPVLPPAPVNPLPPVSPVEPTPPIITPVTPAEPTPPVLIPTPPVVEPTPPVVEEPTAPSPPTASFAFAPASPVIGEVITLDGTASSCPDAPCTYEWSDDGGATRPASILWPLGTGISLSFSFLEVGTKYVRLVVTDAAGQTATVEHNVTVSAPLISAPANTTSPTISGIPIEGDTLSATTGAWSNLPLIYTYQWQDCNSSGQSCSSIAGAISSTYTLTKEDVGNTVRVVVAASNLGGTGSASSAATATVAALAVTEPEPEPVLPPTNTAMPTVKGTTTEGQKLTTTNGGWTGNPTSYVYQWRHCNSSGKSCTNITGASASSYTLAQGDVGDTMRVTVTASNEGGSASMSSPTTAKVTAPAPAAPTNTTPPTISGTTTEAQQLNATPGTWTGSPTSTTYQWQDCDSAGANCANIAGASTSSHTLTAGDVGDTVRVVVSVSNAGGSDSAISAATAVISAIAVSEPEPEPISPPTNTALPAISGTSTEGQTLTATNGSWSPSPTSFTYQWQRCNKTGASCTNVSGSTQKTYSVGSGDVSSTLRVLVSASNAGGSTTATSAVTAAVVAAKSTGQTSCFSSPGACGYPDPSTANVGPSSACSSLTPSGSMTISTAGATVQNMDVKGEVIVNAKNVTLTNDCVSSDGGGTLGSRAVTIAKGVTGTQITDSDIAGANSTSQSVEEALSNNYANANTTADHDYIHNCGECVHGAWTLTNSYVIVNGTVPNCGSECPDHYEDIYCDSSTFVANHDVLLNPEGQTAVLFCDTSGGSGGPALNHITLTNSLVAGGGFTLYPQGNSSSVGSSTMDIANNRFGRCTTAKVFEAQWGTSSCKGGADSHGYWPSGGDYGVASYIYCPPTSAQIWTENVWDDNNEAVGC
jgi:hypothetical protein